MLSIGLKLCWANPPPPRRINPHQCWWTREPKPLLETQWSLQQCHCQTGCKQWGVTLVWSKTWWESKEDIMEDVILYFVLSIIPDVSSINLVMCWIDRVISGIRNGPKSERTWVWGIFAVSAFLLKGLTKVCVPPSISSSKQCWGCVSSATFILKLPPAADWLFHV